MMIDTTHRENTRTSKYKKIIKSKRNEDKQRWFARIIIILFFLVVSSALHYYSVFDQILACYASQCFALETLPLHLALIGLDDFDLHGRLARISIQRKVG